MRDFYEFFAGGGMVRAGLGPGWRCLFANDFDEKKCRAYKENWGDEELLREDVKALEPRHVPSKAHLAWASFPCQDLSLAGMGAGLGGSRSGTFWPFWRLMEALIDEGRGPQLIVLENVCGALSSHGGRDFATICRTLQSGGYSVGAVVVDAALFVPQSRPRLFIICPHRNLDLPSPLIAAGPQDPWHPAALRAAFRTLPLEAKRDWIWWSIPDPPKRTKTLVDLVDFDPPDVRWFTADEVARLVSLMSQNHRLRLLQAKQRNRLVVGTVYRRTRVDACGRRVQRAEVRFDGVAGCLRTPAGGSSRQTLIFVLGESVRARLISSRETARLMGLPDTYKLPLNYNEAYHLTGDGVVVPVVRHLAKHIFEPIIDNFLLNSRAA